MRIVELNQETKKDILSNLLKRSPDNYGTYEATVKEIVEDVHVNKDAALFKYTEKFDKAIINADNIKVTKEEIDEAYKSVDANLLEIIRKAIANIKEVNIKLMISLPKLFFFVVFLLCL